MRLKTDIQRVDDERVMILFSDGLSESYINSLNDLALKEEWKDIDFATLEDDDRIGLVCKPATAVKIFMWDLKRNKPGEKYPDDFYKDFLRKCNEALYEDNLQLYVEKLTKDEEELKKELMEEALKSREKRDDSKDEEKDETWEEGK